ncbi:alpha/beta hydrolase domain-containing protein [Streptomyces phaeochromogenes]|uniref:Alpha/beta hydrolase domain-containing protein n=1 Tax=Streptomyces phaeochromogenes TaxID=1923 RepID=A0ABZ1HSL0_STRPH|nr:alpha/beta hydrolase domain-containing protein [Streptomyces phaeochromogenes]WSD20119.1 alpha/beta hydrolase domain-containing protein [Streptomyces phaeochromogenes]
MRVFRHHSLTDGTSSHLTIGSDEPFEAAKLRELYRDSADYHRRFESRLDELIVEGWLLAEDADDLRREARELEIP